MPTQRTRSFNDGTRMLKRLRMPGDEVNVTPEHVLVNGAEVSTGISQRLGVAGQN